MKEGAGWEDEEERRRMVGVLTEVKVVGRAAERKRALVGRRRGMAGAEGRSEGRGDLGESCCTRVFGNFFVVV